VPGLVRPRGDGTLEKSPAQTLSLAAAAAPDHGDYQLDSYFAPGPILPVLASHSIALSQPAAVAELIRSAVEVTSAVPSTA
jgi:hypothetical protein